MKKKSNNFKINIIIYKILQVPSHSRTVVHVLSFIFVFIGRVPIDRFFHHTDYVIFCIPNII